MKRISLIVFLLVSSTVLFSTNTPEEIFDEGQTHLYNAEYAAAVESFEQYIEVRPNDYRGYWREAYALYLQWKKRERNDEVVPITNQKEEVFPDTSQEERKRFLQLVATGIQNADANIAEQKSADFAKYVKACLIFMRGGVELKNGSVFKAKNSAKEGLAVAAESKYQDARYLTGLVNYRGSHHVVLFTFGGLPHDERTGLEEIYAAFAGNQGPFAADVGFALFGIETDPKNAGQYRKEDVEALACYLLRRGPQNPVIKKYCLEVACGPRGR